MDLWRQMRKRDLSLKKALKSGQNDARRIFTSLGNKVARNKNKIKSRVLRLINDAKRNGKVIWENLNKLTGRGAEK
jgi:hypothetical protein